MRTTGKNRDRKSPFVRMGLPLMIRRHFVRCLPGILGILFFLSGASVAQAQCASASNPIVCENALAGSTSWRLDGPISSDSVAEIQGYASLTSVDTGDAINFLVTVAGNANWNLEIYRMGWYGGDGGRLMLSATGLTGVEQPGCGNPSDENSSYVCNWAVGSGGYTLNVPTSWTTGIYLARLETTLTGHQAYILFVVREDDRTGDYYYEQAVLTYQSYNRYPGIDVSFYSGGGSGVQPWEKTLSFDRPYGSVLFQRNNQSPFGTNGDGSGGFFTWDFPMIQWLEQEGYDVSYATNIDLHETPSRVLDFGAMISVGHDEYWTDGMATASSAARDAGVDLAFFSGNHVFGTVAYDSVNRTMTGMTKAGEPGIGSDRWDHADDYPDKRKRQALIGQANTGCCARKPIAYFNLPWVVDAPSHWVFEDTGFSVGDEVPGILGYEPDGFDPSFAGACTQDFTLLSDSPFTPAAVGDAVGGVADSTYLRPWPLDSAQSTIYQAPSGAWVFSAGTTDWGWGLATPFAAAVPAFAATAGDPMSLGFQNMLTLSGSTQVLADDLGEPAWEADGTAGAAFVHYAQEGSAAWGFAHGYELATNVRVVSGDYTVVFYASGSRRFLPILSVNAAQDELRVQLEAGGFHVLAQGASATAYHQHEVRYSGASNTATYYFDGIPIETWPGAVSKQLGLYFGQGSSSIPGVARFRDVQITAAELLSPDPRIQQTTRNILDRMQGHPDGSQPLFFEADYCGDNSPSRMGWTDSYSNAGTGVALDDGAPAWRADGSEGRATWSVNPSAATEALAALRGWRTESVLRVESGTYLTDYYADGSRRFLPILGLDGSGNLTVQLEGGGFHVLATGAAATAYHTHEIRFDPSSELATYSFDGTAIETWAGSTTAQHQIVFGQGATSISGVGVYRSMRFEVLPIAVPGLDLRAVILLICVLGGLGLTWNYHRRVVS